MASRKQTRPSFLSGVYTDPKCAALIGSGMNSRSCDVQVTTDGEKRTRLHRAVLCGCSEFFRVTFSGSWRESGSNRVDLPQISTAAFLKIMTIIYTRQSSTLTTFNIDELVETLAASHFLQMDEILSLIADNLKLRLSPSSFVDLSQISERYGVIRKELRNFLCSHPNEFLREDSKGIDHLPVSLVASALESNALAVGDEDEVMTMVAAYSKACELSVTQIEGLLAKVRFPHLSRLFALTTAEPMSLSMLSALNNLPTYGVICGQSQWSAQIPPEQFRSRSHYKPHVHLLIKEVFFHRGNQEAGLDRVTVYVICSRNGQKCTLVKGCSQGGDLGWNRLTPGVGGSGNHEFSVHGNYLYSRVNISERLMVVSRSLNGGEFFQQLRFRCEKFLYPISGLLSDGERLYFYGLSRKNGQMSCSWFNNLRDYDIPELNNQLGTIARLTFTPENDGDTEFLPICDCSVPLFSAHQEKKLRIIEDEEFLYLLQGNANRLIIVHKTTKEEYLVDLPPDGICTYQVGDMGFINKHTLAVVTGCSFTDGCSVKLRFMRVHREAMSSSKWRRQVVEVEGILPRELLGKGSLNFLSLHGSPHLHFVPKGYIENASVRHIIFAILMDGSSYLLKEVLANTYQTQSPPAGRYTSHALAAIIPTDMHPCQYCTVMDEYINNDNIGRSLVEVEALRRKIHSVRT